MLLCVETGCESWTFKVSAQVHKAASRCDWQGRANKAPKSQDATAALASRKLPAPLQAAGEDVVARLLAQDGNGLLQAHVEAQALAQVVPQLPELPQLAPHVPAAGLQGFMLRGSNGQHLGGSSAAAGDAVLRHVLLAARPDGCKLLLQDMHLAWHVLIEPLCARSGP